MYMGACINLQLHTWAVWRRDTIDVRTLIISACLFLFAAPRPLLYLILCHYVICHQLQRSHLHSHQPHHGCICHRSPSLKHCTVPLHARPFVTFPRPLKCFWLVPPAAGKANRKFFLLLLFFLLLSFLLEWRKTDDDDVKKIISFCQSLKYLFLFVFYSIFSNQMAEIRKKTWSWDNQLLPAECVGGLGFTADVLLSL